MDAVFAEAYVPKELRAGFLKRCAVLTTARSPGVVWVKCLMELLSLASDNPSVETAVVLRACVACEDALSGGFRAGKVPATERQDSLTVAAKICAWHFNRPPLLEWIESVLRKHAMLPKCGRLNVEVARQLCHKAVNFQGVMRTAAESDQLGKVLLRLAGLGPKGRKTLCLLWQGRNDGDLDYTLRHRAWTFLLGLVEASAGTAHVAVKFDADLWLCAAVEAPSRTRSRLLKQMLAYFRHIKTTDAASALKCTPFKCMADVMIDAVFAHTYAEEPSLVQGVKLFLDDEHAARGCPCSSWRDASFGTGMQPAWGGDGSSGLAMLARHCRDLNTRRAALNGLRYNPTDAVLCTVAPVIGRAAKLVQQDAGKLSATLVEGAVKMHSQQAVAVLAAAPFLECSTARSSPWRHALTEAVRGLPSFWHLCVHQLPLTVSSIVSHHHAWLGSGPVQSIMDVAAAAHAFKTNPCPLQVRRLPGTEGLEGNLICAVVKVLKAFAAADCTIGEWLVQQLQRDSPDLVAVASLGLMLEHPRLPHVMLEGLYDGAWKRCRSGGMTVMTDDVLQRAKEAGGTKCVQLLMHESGAGPLRIPSASPADWWVLGCGFPKAVRYFLWMTHNTHLRLPHELAMMVIKHAARLATVVRRV